MKTKMKKETKMEKEEQNELLERVRYCGCLIKTYLKPNWYDVNVDVEKGNWELSLQFKPNNGIITKQYDSMVKLVLDILEILKIEGLNRNYNIMLNQLMKEIEE